MPPGAGTYASAHLQAQHRLSWITDRSGADLLAAPMSISSLQLRWRRPPFTRLARKGPDEPGIADSHPRGEPARGDAQGISGDMQKFCFGVAPGMPLQRIPR